MIYSLFAIGIMGWLAIIAITLMSIADRVSRMWKLIVAIVLTVCGIAFLFYVSWCKK